MFIFDGHCDSILLSLEEEKSLNKVISGRQFDFVQGLDILNIQQMALFIEEEYMINNGFARTNQLLEKLLNDIRENKQVNLINTFQDLSNLHPNQLGIIMAIEGYGHAYNDYLKDIDYFFSRGIRSMSLTWNFDNELATGCLTNSTKSGLSEKGKAVINRMNALGMVLDVSHLSEQSFWDCVNHTNESIIASHSCCKVICHHPRNLSDNQLKAIAELDGVIGINFYPEFLKPGVSPEKNATIEDIISHLKHMKKIIGTRYLGLGSDFDGIAYSPTDLNSVNDIRTLPNHLHKAGFTITDIEGIMGENFLNLYKRVIPHE